MPVYTGAAIFAAISSVILRRVNYWRFKSLQNRIAAKIAAKIDRLIVIGSSNPQTGFILHIHEYSFQKKLRGSLQL